MKLRFLGTGTSNGVPVIGCDCEVCRSADPRDKRMRSAVLVETDATRVLVDCGPDIRAQLLQVPFRKIDAVLLTHEHYDHTGGLDDLRPFSAFGDVDIYANAATVKVVRHNFPYCFVEKLYPGVPKLRLHDIEKHQPLQIGDIGVMPIGIQHDKLPILGYRFGEVAYITDMKTIDETEYGYLEGLDTLIVNALRWEKPHHSHLIILEAVEFARRVGARQTFFTHLTHQIGLHERASLRLSEGMNFAYDGLTLEF